MTASFWLLALFYLIVAIAAAVVAIRKLHAPWYLLLIGGAVLLAFGYTGLKSGTYIGVHWLHIGKESSPTLRLLPVYTGAFLEEAARIAAVYWLARRRPIEHAIMFGVGFAATETLKKSLFDIPLTTTASHAVFSGILCLEIFAFHLAMTIFLYRAFRDDHSTLYKWGAVIAAILWHVLIDFCSVNATVLFHSIGYSALIWSIVTPINIAIIWWGLRGFGVRAALAGRLSRFSAAE